MPSRLESTQLPRRTGLVRPGKEFDVVARNSLDEAISSSPAISQGQIFIRTHEALYCIGKKP